MKICILKSTILAKWKQEKFQSYIVNERSLIIEPNLYFSLFLKRVYVYYFTIQTPKYDIWIFMRNNWQLKVLKTTVLNREIHRVF